MKNHGVINNSNAPWQGMTLLLIGEETNYTLSAKLLNSLEKSQGKPDLDKWHAYLINIGYYR